MGFTFVLLNNKQQTKQQEIVNIKESWCLHKDKMKILFAHS